MKSSPGTFPAKRSTPCRCFKSTSMKPLLRKVSRTQVLRHPHTGTRTRTRTKVNFDPVTWDVCLGNALRSRPPQSPGSIPSVQYPRSIPYWTEGCRISTVDRGFWPIPICIYIYICLNVHDKVRDHVHLKFFSPLAYGVLVTCRWYVQGLRSLVMTIYIMILLLCMSCCRVAFIIR